jgi:hypothetical protein
LNPQARRVVEECKERREITLKQDKVALSSTEVVKETLNFKFWDCSDEIYQ